MPAIIKDSYKFRRILGDMTGLCNLRCRFCSTDFRHAARNVMPLPVARSLRRLLDLVPEECFYLSFFFEPTLHPHFSEILTSLGSAGREQVIFSTNMACDMDDDAIQALAAAPVKRIILSLHTLRSDVYASLCSGCRVERLLGNLLRLGEACRLREENGDRAPALHFLTVVLRDNYEEIPSLVQLAGERFHAAAHELRTPVYGDHVGLPFTAQQLLDRRELEDLLPRLSAPHENIIYEFTLWRELFAQRRAAGDVPPDMRSLNCPGPVAAGKVLPQRYWDVRLDADGSAYFYGLEESCDLAGPARADTSGEQVRACFTERLARLAAALPARFAGSPQEMRLARDVRHLLSGPECGAACLRQIRLGAQACRIRGLLELPHPLEPDDLILLHWGNMIVRAQRHPLAAALGENSFRWALEAVFPPQDAENLPEEGYLLLLRGERVRIRLPLLPDGAERQ